MSARALFVFGIFKVLLSFEKYKPPLNPPRLAESKRVLGKGGEENTTETYLPPLFLVSIVWHLVSNI